MTADQPETVDFAALHEQIQSHPGTIARRAWDSLVDIHAVMNANQAELLAFIVAVEQDPESPRLAGNVGPTEPRRAMFRELIRLLHNYVASVGTLVDHTRNLTRRYEGTDTYTGYETRRLDAISNEVVSFVSKLRNYVLHVGVPAVGIQFRFSDGAQSVVLFFDRDMALAWKDWPKAARSYLEAKPKEFPIVAVIQEYAAVIEGLYRWLYEQFEPLHGDDIAAVNDLIRKQWSFGLINE